MKIFLTVFFTVLFAELGDKTQLATMLFATDENTSRWMVFIAASLALITATALAVLLGGALTRFIPEIWLQRLAGVGFVIIGLWVLWSSSPGAT